MSGIIEDTGSSANLFEKGEKVVIQPIGYCGKCAYCNQGRYNLCPDGEWAGFELNGGFAEYVKCEPKNLLKSPENISFEEGACMETVALALHTISIVKPQIGETVAILGQGPVGLMQTQALKMSGLNVIAVDPRRRARQIAERLGADYVFNPESVDLGKEVRKVTRGLGADISVEAAGTQETVDLTSSITKPGGRIAFAGSGRHLRGPSIELTKEHSMFSVELSPLEYPLALDMVSHGKIQIKPLITHRFSLEKGPQVFKALGTGQLNAMKVILVP
jgi:L-iditol 2-dehydrogenase